MSRLNPFYLILSVIVYLGSLLPLRVLYALSKLLYFIGWKVIGYRKSVIIQNLTRSFPEKKYREIDQVANQYAVHLFQIFAEWLKSFSESKRSRINRIDFRNKELLNQEGNVFLVLGHYGNWEMLNILPLFTDKPAYAIYQEQTSSTSDLLSRKMRIRFGLHLLEANDAAYFIAKNKVPSVYVFIADQSPSSRSKFILSFLNQPTRVFGGVERLSKLKDSAVVYAEIMPQKKRRYIFTLSKVNESDITADFFHQLEQTIQHQPQYWLWSHRRWKHNIQ